MIYALGIIILFVCFLFVFLFFKNSKLKDIKESLDISINNIERVLEEKLKLVNSLMEYVDDEKIKVKFKYKQEDTLVDRESALFETSFDVNKYFKEKGVNGKNKDEIKGRIHALNILEEELDGLKDFYNANVIDYEEIFLKKYLNKLFRYLKYDDYKTFKIRKLEEYEIFKN